ncbi:MAG TPA: thiamine pyrophosphate-dependent enzyme, partial [Candidatus Manganitrophaceae bacterium]
LWRLPVIYICENNRFGMGTPVERSSSLYDIAHAARAYEMPFHHFDGMDVMDVYHHMTEIIEGVRKSKRPIFVEARTYRYMGHSMSDPAHGHYRTKEEIDEQKKRDPILTLQKRLIEEKILSAEEIKKIEREIQEIIQEAVEFADKSPEPPISSLTEDVYA